MKTLCKNGHPRTPQNLRPGRSDCAICHREQQLARNRKAGVLPLGTVSADRLPHMLPDGTYEVPLSRGKAAYIDAVDLPVVAEHTWWAEHRDRTWYARTHIGRRNVYMHSLLMPYSPQVDHRDSDGLNNRRYNLRAATNTQNRRNGRAHRRNRLGLKGVWQLPSGTYAVSIMADHQRYNLGYFATAEEAALAYDAAARELHGDFARCNFPVADDRRNIA